MDENGLTAMSRDVRIYPVNADPFIAYLDIGIDTQTLEVPKGQIVLDVQKADLFYAGTPGVH